MSIFMTGTDTNVGKTFISALLCKIFQKNGIGYFKPLQTGLDHDCRTIQHLSSLHESQIFEPCYSFPEAISPNRAARLNHCTIQMQNIVQHFHALDHKHLIVEGAGGVMVPLNSEETMIDLMKALQLPVIVVARTELGTLNHTLLTLTALKTQKLNCLGVVCVGEPDPGLSEIITEHSGMQVLAEIPRFSEINREVTASLADSALGQNLFKSLAGFL